ncbi:aspartic peptidase domain-containing protein [Pseudoneurospora amorphoporcata]|uniref:Aspartic peptidase domain-containing protein n=1 Tax=Pseudoneurospora amorphoporcata TaxID=241081 RepID=A0AAN6SGA0_9PEZI|nr:aspartic peptidase domain-containing protein [Pseudoneurospora amorphoporcata]
MEFSVLISALLLLAAHSLAAVVSPGSPHHLRRGDSKSPASFSLPAHYNAAFHSVHHDQPSNHGLLSYYKSLSRLNVNPDSIPPGLKKVVFIEDTSSSDKPKGGGVSSSLPTTPFWEEREYLSELTVGTPPQKLLVNIDTGSVSFWVLSSETFIANKTRRVLYDIGKSSTAEKVVNASWATYYADGSYAAGNVYHDTLHLGSIKIPKAVVQSALEVSLDLAVDLATSGIMGLAYNMSSEVHPLGTETTVSEQLYERLDQPLMTIDLRTRANGTYTFGSVPTVEKGEKGKNERAPYKGEINYYPLSRSEYWQTGYTFFAIANSTYQSEWMNGLEDADPLSDTGTGPSPTSSSATNAAATATLTLHEAIIDTGTSLLLLPASIVNKYYAHVPGAVFRTEYNTWTYPCDLKVPLHTRSGPPPAAGASTDEEIKPVLPDLKIAFGEKGGWHATIPGALFNFSVVEVEEEDSSSTRFARAQQQRPASLKDFVFGGNDKKEKKDDDDPPMPAGMITQCMGGIQNNMGLDVGIFGDTFFKAVFVVLDMRGRVGFADKDL